MRCKVLIKRIALFLCLGVIMICLGSCDSQKEPKKTSKKADNVTQEIRKEKVFRFSSPEEVEAISDEDLLYILEHNYVTEDFFPEGSYHKLDLFDVEMQVPTKKNPDAAAEYVMTVILEQEDLEEAVDLTVPLSTELINEYAVADCHHFMDIQNTMEPGDKTGILVKDKQVIFCGETDGYVEYSARYTDSRSLYENHWLVTHNIPRAYRRVYMKSFLNTAKNQRELLMLGELSKEYIEEQLDVYWGSNKMMYREVTEQENRFVYTQYYYGMVHGDYGVDSEACLYKHMVTIDKNSREVYFCNPEQVKRVTIPGSAVDWPTDDWW